MYADFKTLSRRLGDSRTGFRLGLKKLTMLQMWRTTSGKQVEVKDADLCNFGKEWNSYDEKQEEIYRSTGL